MKMVGAAMIAALSMTVGARAQQMNDTQRHDEPMKAKAETYVGCVARGATADAFVLEAPMQGTAMTPMKKDSMNDAAMPAGSAMKHDTMQNIQPSPDGMKNSMMADTAFKLAGSHLKNYVGRTVSVEGSLIRGTGQTSMDTPTFKVKSIKVLSGTCSQAD